MKTSNVRPLEDWEADYARGLAAAKAWATENKIKITGIKIFVAGSEETNCFVAKITRDGKTVGGAENNGHGGSTSVWCGAGTLAGLGGLKVDDDAMLEILADDAVEEELTRRETARALNAARRWGKKRGFGALAYFLGGEALEYAGYPKSYGAEAIAAHLASKGRSAWTVEAL